MELETGQLPQQQDKGPEEVDQRLLQPAPSQQPGKTVKNAMLRPPATTQPQPAATAGSGSVERTLGLSYWPHRSPWIRPGTKAYEAGSKPLGEWLRRVQQRAKRAWEEQRQAAGQAWRQLSQALNHYRAHHPQLAGTAIGPMSLHGSVDGLGSTGGLYAEPSEPGPNTPPLAKHSKRTRAEQAAEPTQTTKGKGKAKGKAAKAKLAPQPGRWLDRDCNAALNMQRTGESRWCPLELCWWPNQAALPAKDKEYPELGYKRLRDRPPKAQQQQQQQPARAQ
ncbi:hypothetical protein QJQ45_003818 [Haematococcus lacustris]|nr:hypothetical protein QJQ45_003818 [Haematococcus lacustris]